MTTEQILGVIATVLVALIGSAGVFYANRTQRGSREHKLVDQFQEEMASMRKRMDGFEARDRVYIPHILKQHRHIELGLGPPAPPIPDVIQRYLDGDPS